MYENGCGKPMEGCYPLPPEPPVCRPTVPPYPQPVPPINPGPFPAPPPDMPGYCPPGLPRPAPQMPPVPSVVEGSSLYEAVNKLTDRVNLCIRTYNDVMRHGYKTLHDMQRAAESNGSYYTKGEVWTEVGYDADQGANYTLIHKAAVDDRNQPIRIQLHLAYGNTTNSQVPESIFHASEQIFADKIVVAQPKQVGGWYGVSMLNCTPIPSVDEASLYTMGFTRNGTMRVYSNTVSADQLLADQVVDAMGVSGVLIQDGQILDDAWTANIPQRDIQTSRVCVGQNTATGEVIFIVTGKENDVNKKGMTTAACAQILLKYGCTIAVELCEGTGTGAADKGQLMFAPADNQVPQAFCYWYITRRCSYRNDYQAELARLVQLYGQQIWNSYLNGQNILATQANIDQEIKDRKAGDAALQNAIDAETQRATAAEKLLDVNLKAEIERATAAEAAISANVTKVTEDLAQEVINRENADADLQTNINTEINRATEAERMLQQNINAEVDRATQAEETLDTKFTSEVDKINKLYQALTQQVTTMDATIVSMQVTINEIESSLNTIKDLIAESQRLVNEVNELLKDLKTGDADIPYLPLKGGAMTGPVSTSQTTFEDNEFITKGGVTNITDAISDDLADTKAELDNFKSEVGTDYLPLAGGTVTGPVKTTQLDFQDDEFITLKPVQELSETVSESINNLGKEVDRVQSEVLQIVGGHSNVVTKDGTSLVTGDIQVPAPAGGTSVANKNYVDNAVNEGIEGLQGDVIDLSGKLSNYVSKTGTSIVEGDIQVPPPAGAKSTVNKEYVEAEVDSALQSAKDYTDNEFSGLEAMIDGYMPISGGTFTGPVSGQTPSNDGNFVTKAYADNNGLTQAKKDGLPAWYGEKVYRLMTERTEYVFGMDDAETAHNNMYCPVFKWPAGSNCTTTIRYVMGTYQGGCEIFTVIRDNVAKNPNILTWFLNKPATSTGDIVITESDGMYTAWLAKSTYQWVFMMAYAQCQWQNLKFERVEDRTWIAAPTGTKKWNLQSQTHGFMPIEGYKLGAEMTGDLVLGQHATDASASNRLAFKNSGFTSQQAQIFSGLSGETAYLRFFARTTDGGSWGDPVLRGTGWPIYANDAANKKYVDHFVRSLTVTPNVWTQSGSIYVYTLATGLVTTDQINLSASLDNLQKLKASIVPVNNNGTCYLQTTIAPTEPITFQYTVVHTRNS